MTRVQLRELRRIQELEFRLLEFNLYLNTHPRDKKALEKFNQTARELNRVKDNYQQQYGPLTAKRESDFPWQYPQTAWPWQISY